MASDTARVTSSSAAPLPEARRGVPAASSRVRFAPEHLDLPGGRTAAVHPAVTVRGELQVPEDVEHIGWWDGSAYAGDPFGSTVLAGHIDSAEQGLGFFTALLDMQPGDVVALRSGDQALRYQVTSTALVDKDVLASDTSAFDQRGQHRLVLITCSGRWRPEVHSYESNLVVVAHPAATQQP
ncbi:MAG: class F sortase [Actinobacteria bacterium]|nr:class F sortase [Actinomycetota bacterium]